MSDPLVTLESFSELVGTDFSPTDPKPLRVLNMASTAIRSEARETFTLDDEDQQLRGNWTDELHLPRPPVISVGQIEFRCGGETAFTALGSGDFTFDRMGLVLKLCGYWGGSRGIVHVAYSRGYDSVPEDVADICLSVAKRLFVYAERFSDGQVRDAEAGVSVGFTEREMRVIHRYEPVGR